MAVQANVITLPGLVAVGDLSSKQFHFVKSSSTAGGQVKAVSATTDAAIGILQNKPGNAEEALVAVGGLAKVAVATSVGWNDGSFVGWDTTGKGVPLAANSTNDNRLVLGKFHKLSGQGTVVANQVVSIQMFPAAQRI